MLGINEESDMKYYNIHIDTSIVMTLKKTIGPFIDAFLVIGFMVTVVFCTKPILNLKRYVLLIMLYTCLVFLASIAIVRIVDLKKYCFTLTKDGIELINIKGKYFIPYEEVKSSGLLHDVRYGVKYTYYISVIYFSTEQLTDKELKKRMRDITAINGSLKSTKKLIYISLPKEEAIELHKTMQNWLKANVGENILK